MNRRADLAPPPSAWRRDVTVALIAAVLLLAWDASGLDLAAARLFGNADGFAWRNAWLTQRVLHDGGRWLGWLALALLALHAWQPRLGRGVARPSTPSGAWRMRGVLATLVCLVAVPSLKRASHSSCPWDVAEFGGRASYVSHWLAGVTDGGPGHCFPSGHAVAAFAFFSVYFTWRHHAPARARAALVAVLVVGTVFGVTQLARGAHYPSHTAWSAWLCWVICAVVFNVGTRRQPAITPPSAAMSPIADLD